MKVLAISIVYLWINNITCACVKKLHTSFAHTHKVPPMFIQSSVLTNEERILNIHQISHYP